MFRATTPLHRFVFDQDPEQFEKILITYSQYGRTILEKRESDLSFSQPEEGTFQAAVRLTQKEANLFKAGKVSIQIRALFPDGSVIASDIITVPVKDVLNDEVLV